MDRVDCFIFVKLSEGSFSLMNLLVCSGSKSRKWYNLFLIYKICKNVMNVWGKIFVLGVFGF